VAVGTVRVQQQKKSLDAILWLQLLFYDRKITPPNPFGSIGSIGTLRQSPKCTKCAPESPGFNLVPLDFPHKGAFCLNN